MPSSTVAIITNIPSPYRVYFFDKLANCYSGNIKVFYCAPIESNRHWHVPIPKHDHFFLNTKKIYTNLYYHSDIWLQLSNYKPDIIITSGFTPVMLKAWTFSLLKNKKHIVLTDSWLLPVRNLTPMHRIIRKLVFRFSYAFICIGKKGKEFLKSYGCDSRKIFISPLVFDNHLYNEKRFKSMNERKYDLMFSGQINHIKMPFFIVDILKSLKKHKSDINLLITGDGPLRSEFISALEKESIAHFYAGFIQPEKLVDYYCDAKILLFPSQCDPWGLVANEAMSAGTPVITCSNAGVADDLVINEFNGFVLPIVVTTWVDHIITLLNDSKLYEIYSHNALKAVRNVNTEIAVDNFILALES